MYGDIFKPIDGSWSSHDHCRHFMYEEIYASIRDNVKWENKDYNLIEFGTREPTSSIIRMIVYDMRNKDITSTLNAKVVDYPTVDLQSTIYDDNEWDITIADQVLEHVERPWLAADELYRITKPDGLCIVNTPFLHPIHPNPIDCWRITPDGYKVLFPESKWERVLAGMWGNRNIIEWEYNSPITRGLTGDWLSVAQAKEIMPCYNEPTDNLNPIVLFNVMVKN